MPVVQCCIEMLLCTHISSAYLAERPQLSVSRAPRLTVSNTLVQQLVHPADLAGYTIVNGPLPDVDDEATEDVGIDFCDDLQFLAL